MTKRLPIDDSKDDPIKDFGYERRSLYANFYHLIFKFKKMKSISSDTFDYHLLQTKSLNISKYDFISATMEQNFSSNNEFINESGLSESYTEAEKGQYFASYWTAILFKQIHKIESKCVSLKKFKVAAEVRRLNITNATNITSSKLNNFSVKIDTMNKDTCSSSKKNSGSVVQTVLDDERIIKNSFDSKLTRNDIEFQTDLEIDGIKITDSIEGVNKIDLVQVEIKKPCFLSTTIKLAMCAIKLMIKDNDIEYTSLDKKKLLYRRIDTKFFQVQRIHRFNY